MADPDRRARFALTLSVADKALLGAEIRRVLRPGGRLSLFEVVREGRDELHYPDRAGIAH